MPDILAGNDFRAIIEAIRYAKMHDKPVIAMIGGHVIKCGLSPIIIDLVQKGYITSIAMNGAAAIHDFEIAMLGATSEDVEENLKDGKFGMWDEVGQRMNDAIKSDVLDFHQKGMGDLLSIYMQWNSQDYDSFRQYSLLGNSELYWARTPITVHVAIGTDIIHQHPAANGALIGAASLKDFLLLSEQLQSIGQGGVVLNFGSAVILPEVFLKALNLAKNKGHDINGFTTANFDMIPQYRAIKNIVERPSVFDAKGYNFIGHHEIMIPLLAGALWDD